MPALPPPNSAIAALPLGPALTTMIDVSRTNLARRRSIALTDVMLVQVWTVVWPDGGLGCLWPGMVYPQVQFHGLRIRLRIGQQTFDYHTDGLKPPFLCKQGQRGAPPPTPLAAPGTMLSALTNRPALVVATLAPPAPVSARARRAAKRR